KPIRRLAEGAKEIAKGDFDQKFSMNSGDELENLAASFNFMTDELKKYTENMAKAAAEKERSRTELKVAAKIQTDMLPRNFADFDCQPEFDIYALMEPAKNVGGDFYDFYLLQGRYLVITVADVSGKGVPAALFMAKSQSVLKNCVLRINNPEDMAGVLTEANKELCSNNDAAMFVTVFIGALDLQTGHFTYASGGHCPPLLGQDGHYEFVSMATNCVLGLMEMPYIQHSLDLKPQDTLFVYTDGVSEAMNEQRKMFTEARIKAALNDLPAAQPVTDILQQMYAVIRQYAGNAEQSDDITMLGLRYNG
ncbi:MAG: SpoIIE family protein phosphatase, partial [Selenomonas sp.]|nr:SpoIIE family protein phosphatase [Selenomonas sp.]